MSSKIDKITYNFNEKESLLTAVWTEECGNILDEENDPFITELKYQTEKTGASRVIVDLSNCTLFQKADKYLNKPDIILSKFDLSSADKIAVVVPSNIFDFAYYEGGHQSLKHKSNKMQFFNTLKKAQMWMEHTD